MESFSHNCERNLKIGVLAIIGSFVEHINVTVHAAEALRARCGGAWINTKVEAIPIRQANQVDDSLDALIVPGGETTVITRFIETNNFANHLKLWTENSKKFVWGTCAGLIILSNKIENAGRIPISAIGGIDITCKRNGIGRQRESHFMDIDVTNPLVQNPYGDSYTKSKDTKNFTGVFIRAPTIESVDSDTVDVLCYRQRLQDLSEEAQFGDVSQAVGVIQGNKMATTFHPELTDDLRWHVFFLQQTMNRKYPF